MSNSVHFQCRRFVDLQIDGKEEESPNNYGYTIFNDTSESFTTGMNKEGILDLLNYDTKQVIGVIEDLDDEPLRSLFLSSIEKDKGLYINRTWRNIE